MRPLAILWILTLTACAASVPVADDAAVPQQYAHIPRVGDDPAIEAPVAVRRVDPIATPDMLQRRPLTAKVEAVINADGRVEAIWYSSGDRDWAGAIGVALKKWEFQPARRNGTPVAVRYVLTSALR